MWISLLKNWTTSVLCPGVKVREAHMAGEHHQLGKLGNLAWMNSLGKYRSVAGAHFDCSTDLDSNKFTHIMFCQHVQLYIAEAREGSQESSNTFTRKGYDNSRINFTTITFDRFDVVCH